MLLCFHVHQCYIFAIKSEGGNMPFHFKFAPDKHNPFLSEWPDMPRASFASMNEAKAAAETFTSMSSAGGYNPEMNVWWARQDNGDMHSMTQFTIAER
jgi:hypothetical protein